MSALQFDDADFPASTPQTAPAPTEGPSSSDLACEVCGTPLVYAGSGAKPRFCAEHKRRPAGGASSRPIGSASTQVRQALSVLQGCYDAVSLGFMVTSPEAASMWAQQIEELQARNKTALEADPALAKSICKMGASGGRFTFFASQMYALTPPTLIAVGAMREKRAAAVAEARREQIRRQNQAAGQAPTESPFPGPQPEGNGSFFDRP